MSPNRCEKNKHINYFSYNNMRAKNVLRFQTLIRRGMIILTLCDMDS